MISLKQLSYALAVEKTLHFKKAAELCHISQSALSTALSELESRLNIQILERNNKKVLVTPIGKEVLNRARKIMLEVEELEHLSDSLKAPLSFPLSIGIIPTIAPYILPKVLPNLHQEYPNAQINILEEPSATLLELLRAGVIDSAILALPYPCDGLLAIEFWQEDFYWVGLKENDYATQSEISSTQVANCHLMLLKEGHCLKDHALEVCKLSSKSLHYDVGTNNLDTLIQMVLSNMGNTLIPAMAKDQLLDINESLVAVHLNEPSPHRRIAFIVRQNYTRFSSIEALAELCKKALLKSMPMTS